MSSPAELNRNFTALLERLPNYANRARLQQEIMLLMGTESNQEYFGSVVSSVLSSLHGTATTLKPLAATVRRPWTAMPEQAEWGGQSWIRVVGELVIQNAPQQGSNESNQQRPTTPSAANFLPGNNATAAGMAINTLITAQRAINNATTYSQEGEITGSTTKIPYHLWLAAEFPNCYPLLYVIPGAHTRIKAGHQKVSQDGRVYLISLSQWNPTSRLYGVLLEAVQVFTALPPLQSTMVEDLAAAAAKTGVKLAKNAFNLAKQVVTTTATRGPSHVAQAAASRMPRSSLVSVLTGIVAGAGSTSSGPPENNPSQTATGLPERQPEEDTKATDPGTECVICMENKKAAFLRPCGHVSVCMGCSKSIRECPLCRKPITEVFKAFI